MSGMSKVAGAIRELDPQIVEDSTSGINFPASKNDLISRAKESQAPPAVLDALNQFGDRQYKDPADIKSEFQRVQQK